jgi:hypothetical protein
MAPEERIAQLRSWIKEDPEDPFPLYGLALETTYLDDKEIQFIWETLLQKFPDYLPSYFHAGAYFQTKSRLSLALDIWEKGIQLAILKNDQHALTELRNIRQNALLDDD